MLIGRLVCFNVGEADYRWNNDFNSPYTVFSAYRIFRTGAFRAFSTSAIAHIYVILSDTVCAQVQVVVCTRFAVLSEGYAFSRLSWLVKTFLNAYFVYFIYLGRNGAILSHGGRKANIVDREGQPSLVYRPSLRSQVSRVTKSKTSIFSTFFFFIAHRKMAYSLFARDLLSILAGLYLSGCYGTIVSCRLRTKGQTSTT